MDSAPSFDQYYRITSAFYRKLIRIHPRKIQLIEKFTKMIENFSKKKDQKQDNLSIMGRKNRLDNDDAKSLSNISGRSLSKSQRSQRKIVLKSIDGDYLFLSTKFQKVIVFGYLYYVIDILNEKAMRMLETTSALLLQSVNKRDYLDVNWEKANMQWKKIRQLFPNKSKVRWNKMLADSLPSLPQLYIEIIWRAMTGVNIHAQLDFRPIESNFIRLASQLKLKISYFECNDGAITSKKSYGSSSNEIVIGYLVSDNKFACFEKVPVKDESDGRIVEDKSKLKIDTAEFTHLSINSAESKKSDLMKSNERDRQENSPVDSTTLNLMKKRTARQIQNLLKDMRINSSRLLDLECLKSEEHPKDRKIKEMLVKSRENNG